MRPSTLVMGPGAIRWHQLPPPVGEFKSHPDKATPRDSLRSVTSYATSRSRDDPASIPRTVPVALCRKMPDSVLDQAFRGQHNTQPHALDGLGPSDKRKVTGSTPVPTTTDDQASRLVIIHFRTVPMTRAIQESMMPEIEPTAELHEGFSQPDATARPWAEVVDVLSKSEMFWLSTVRRDRRPHVTPLPAMWLDGALHFCAGAGEQKANNLESDPRCILTTGTNQLRSGLDWDFEVTDGAFRDPDGRRGLVFGVTPTKVLSFGKGEPYSQTRYRFTA